MIDSAAVDRGLFLAFQLIRERGETTMPFRDFLLKELVPGLHKSLRKKARSWINSLTLDDDSDLLGFCIAIDLGSRALRATQFDPIFREMADPPFGSPRQAFAEAAERCPEVLQKQSRYTARGADEDPPNYANVLDLTSFVEHYYPHLTFDELERAKVELFGDSSTVAVQERTLEDLLTPFKGPDGLVWVGREEASWSPTNELATEDATRLHDMLGLGEAWRGEMVYIRYPRGFQPEECVQPSCLDCGWKRAGACYLSAAEGDHWGSTHSRTGSHEPVRERIHGPIANFTDQFTALLLSEPEIKPRNDLALRATARQRLEAAQRLETP